VYGQARRLRLPLLLLALLVASCAPGRTPSPAIGPIPLPAVSAPIISGADQLVPLPDGPSAFAAIVDLLRAARRSIELELYEFQRLDLVAMLLDAHDRGLTVTAIKDPSERSSETSWAVLEQGGVRVVAFPLERLTIDHVKLLIVDGVRAIVGGINWGSHSALNHDVDVLAAGPVVDNLERVFRQDLALAGEPTPIPPPAPDRHVEVLVTHPGDGIRAAALAAVKPRDRSKPQPGERPEAKTPAQRRLSRRPHCARAGPPPRASAPDSQPIQSIENQHSTKRPRDHALADAEFRQPAGEAKLRSLSRKANATISLTTCSMSSRSAVSIGECM